MTIAPETPLSVTEPARPATAAHAAPPALGNAALLAGFLIVAAAIHAAIVAAWANPIPYSDEWIAIVDDVLRRSATGQLGLWNLFQPHNEHTMAPTRLLALVALWLNHGQFDNVPVALLNAALYAGAMALPIALFFRHAEGPLRLFALVLGIAALAPIEGEDLIFGFQNQYYFMIAGTVATLWLATATSASKRALAAFAALALATCVSMGTGFVAAALGAAIGAVRLRQEPQRRGILIKYIATGAAITLLGIVLAIHAFAVMKQHGILGDRHIDLDGIRRVLSCLAWPYGANPVLGAALALPFAAFAARTVWRRDPSSRLDLLALGLGLWAGAQVCALAFDRHSEATSLASRYLPVILFWPAMNVYALFRLAIDASARASRRWANVLPLLPLLAAGALISNVAKLVPVSLAAVAVASQQHQMQAEHVARYVRLGDRNAIYAAGHMQVPYPNFDKLRSLLDDPAVRAGLPANVRAPLALAPAANRPGVFVPFGAYTTVPRRDDLPGYGSFGETGNPTVGTFRSETLASEFPYVRIDLAGYLPDPALSLKLDCPPPATCEASDIRPAEYARESWQGIYVRVPQSHFRIVADDETRTLWMAFSAPLEVGRLSVLTDALINRLRSQSNVYAALLCGNVSVLLLVGLWRAWAPQATLPRNDT
jgi:hypothetical protein